LPSASSSGYHRAGYDRIRFADRFGEQAASSVSDESPDPQSPLRTTVPTSAFRRQFDEVTVITSDVVPSGDRKKVPDAPTSHSVNSLQRSALLDPSDAFRFPVAEKNGSGKPIFVQFEFSNSPRVQGTAPDCLSKSIKCWHPAGYCVIV